jgi:hypothetical protein
LLRHGTSQDFERQKDRQENQPGFANQANFLPFALSLHRSKVM